MNCAVSPQRNGTTAGIGLTQHGSGVHDARFGSTLSGRPRRIAIRPQTNSSIAQITIGNDDHPVVGMEPLDEPDDVRTVVAVTTAGDEVVVVVAAGFAVVVVVADLAVVVVAPPAAVVVVAAMVVVVAVEAATTVHVIPDGTSAGVTANVSCTFQYLSSCVADAVPSVHAMPTL